MFYELSIQGSDLPVQNCAVKKLKSEARRNERPGCAIRLTISQERKAAADSVIKTYETLVKTTASEAVSQPWLKAPPDSVDELRRQLSRYQAALGVPANSSADPNVSNLVGVPLSQIVVADLLELAWDILHTKSKEIYIPERLWELVRMYVAMFTSPHLVSIRCRSSFDALVNAPNLLEAEKLLVLTNERLVGFANALLTQKLTVRPRAQVEIDGVPLRTTDPTLVLLLLVLAYCAPSFSSTDFCERFNRSTKNASKDCYRYLNRIKRVLPSLSWHPHSGKLIVSGVEIELCCSKEELSKAVARLRNAAWCGENHSESTQIPSE